MTIANLYPKKYGSFERYCVFLSKVLIRENHQHIIIFNNEPIPHVRQLLEESGAIVFENNFGTLGLLGSLKLIWYLKKYNIDIVHMHFYRTFSLFSFFVKFMKVKYFITYHMGLYKCYRNPIINFFKKNRSFILGFGINKIFCVSKYTQDVVVNNYKLDISLTEVIYNGIDINDYIVENINLENNNLKINIISVANLIKEKGIQYLITAIPLVLQKYRNCSFTIVGDGPYMCELKELVDNLQLSQYVVFLGSRDDVPQLYMSSDIAVIPSVVPEGFGFTIIEAMAAQLPVIASNVGAIPEIIEGGLNGFVVNPADPHVIAERIIFLIQNPEMMANMKTANRNKVMSVFTLERVCEKQLQFYFYSNV